MKGDFIFTLIGKSYKIIVKEPGQIRPSIISGKITEFDKESGLIFIESDKGLGCINIENITAIKPVKK